MQDVFDLGHVNAGEGADFLLGGGREGMEGGSDGESKEGERNVC